MGQVTLGLRSLAFKLAVFVVMAALLAWALGGTLWPRAEQVRMDDIEFGGSEWYWRLSVGGSESQTIRWHLIRSDGESNTPVDEQAWAEAAGLVTLDGSLYAAARFPTSESGSGWVVRELDASGRTVAEHPMPDRLAVEQQMARLRQGKGLQGIETILRQRDRVLDPIDDEAADDA